MVFDVVDKAKPVDGKGCTFHMIMMMTITDSSEVANKMSIFCSFKVSHASSEKMDI